MFMVQNSKGTVKRGPSLYSDQEFIPPQGHSLCGVYYVSSQRKSVHKRVYESTDFIFPAKRVIFFSLILELIVATIWS